MPPGPVDLTALAERAAAAETAVRRALGAFGGMIPVTTDASKADEPALWIGNEVLLVFGTDAAAVGRIGAGMETIDEFGRFPPDAVGDAVKAAVGALLERAVARAVESSLMERGR